MAVKVKVKSGDPKKGTVEEKSFISQGRTPLDDTADVRDILSGIVGGGYTGLSDDTARAKYTRLQALVGPDKAQKLMTHMFIFNQNPATQKLPVEARIKSFYDNPAGDADVSGVLGKVKSFGYGVLPGFRESTSFSNSQLAGQVPMTAVVTPEQKAVKLRIGNKL